MIFHKLIPIPALILYCLTPLSTSAIYFGNPSQPAMQTEGIILGESNKFSFRIGYLSDTVYHQPYTDEFPLLGTNQILSDMKLSTDGATLTLNFKNRLDMNVLIGQSQTKIDREVCTEPQFSWGIGSKYVLYTNNTIAVGIDFKYFQSKQNPAYFVSEGYAYKVLSDYTLFYREIEAAFGFSYLMNFLSPYIYATALYSKIQPSPLAVIIRLPFSNISVGTTSRSITTQEIWGVAIGATISGGKSSSLTLEARFFNQNAVSVSGEIRF